MSTGIDFRVRIDATSDPLSDLLTPRQVERVNRLVINKIVRSTTTKVGGDIPRAAKTSVVGFRRKRVFKTLARARRTIVKGSVWIGGNRIQARYGGAMKNVRGGAKAGRHFFAGAMKIKFRSGYESIFRRTADRRLEEETIQVRDVDKHAERALDSNRTMIEGFIHTEINKILERNVN